MSIEKLLRSFKDDQADRLADAWHDHERRQDERHYALRLDIDKAVGRSTLSVTLAGLTLAALLAATLYVGPELGALRERVGSMRQQLDTLTVKLDAQAKVIDAIDARTRRMEQAAIQTTPDPAVVAGKPEENRTDQALTKNLEIAQLNKFIWNVQDNGAAIIAVSGLAQAKAENDLIKAYSSEIMAHYDSFRKELTYISDLLSVKEEVSAPSSYPTARATIDIMTSSSAGSFDSQYISSLYFLQRRNQIFLSESIDIVKNENFRSFLSDSLKKSEPYLKRTREFLEAAASPSHSPLQ